MKRFIASLALGVIFSGIAFAQTEPAATMPATAPATQPKANAAIPDDLAKAMTNALTLAQDKKYKELIETLAPPDAIADMKAHGGTDAVAADFGTHAQELIDALSQALTTAPTLSDDKKTATFKVAAGPHDDMVFTKIDDKWYLK